MYIRNDKGVVGSDIAISIIILMLFVAIVTTIFYQINMTNISTTRHATATNCVVNIIEYIKLMPYDETFLDTDLDKTWCTENRNRCTRWI